MATSDYIEAAARDLARAWQSGARLTSPAGSREPVDAEEAYLIQDAVVASFGGFAGWKVGRAGEGAPIMRGPILPGRVFPSPARLDRSSFRVVGIEAEIAFRLDRDVGEWSSDDGRSLPMTAHAAIEVVDSRYSDLKAMSPVAVLADNFANSALVPGAALPPELVSSCPPLTLHDESGIFSPTRANLSGNPYALAMMLVLQCTARGITLPAGTWITTGSYTGLRFANGERHFSVRHGEATLVELHLHDTGDQPE